MPPPSDSDSASDSVPDSVTVSDSNPICVSDPLVLNVCTPPPVAPRHTLVLSIGSNIKAEWYLPRAIQTLRAQCDVRAVSRVYENASVGYAGPNFLNCCVRVTTTRDATRFKRDVIAPLERLLGRVRQEDRNAPRTIDVDIEVADNHLINLATCQYAFVVVPLADLMPALVHPHFGEAMHVVAQRLLKDTWMSERRDIDLHALS